MPAATVDKKVKESFTNIIKFHNVQCAYYKLSDDHSHIILDGSIPKVSRRSTKKVWDAFTNSLSGDRCMYAVCDLMITVGEGTINKVIMVSW